VWVLGPEAQALLQTAPGGPTPEAVFAQRDAARQRTNAGKKRLGSDRANDPCLNRIICGTEITPVSSDTQILVTVRLNWPSILWWVSCRLTELGEFKSGVAAPVDDKSPSRSLMP